MSEPRGTVTTKFGIITLIPTDANHIYATSDPAGGATKNPITIRGIQYRASAHLYRYQDGKWRVGAPTAHEYQRPNEAYMSFAEFRGKDPSIPAKRAWIEEIERVVNQWAAKNVKSITNAEVADLTAKIARREGDIQELRAKISAAQADIKNLLAKLEIAKR